MSNSEVVDERVTRPECVVCGWREYDVREVTEVGEGQDDELVGDRFDRCRNCGEDYDQSADY